jgi:hypothetical protein
MRLEIRELAIEEDEAVSPGPQQSRDEGATDISIRPGDQYRHNLSYSITR